MAAHTKEEAGFWIWFVFTERRKCNRVGSEKPGIGGSDRCGNREKRGTMKERTKQKTEDPRVT